MTDEIVEAQSPAPGVDEPSAGTMLREAREASGLQMADLAGVMKVPVKKLEALEGDRFDELPDSVFVRALAASVCRTLKVNPATVLDKLPQSPRPQLDKRERSVYIPVHTPGFPVVKSLLTFVLKPAVLVVTALLLGVAALLFVPDTFNPLALWDSYTATPPAPPVPAVRQPEKEEKVPVAPVESLLPAERIASSTAAPAAKVASAPGVAKPAAALALAAPAKVVVVPAVAAPAVPAKVASAPALAVPAKVASAPALAAPSKVASAPALAVPAKVASAAAAVAVPSTPANPGLLVFKAREKSWLRVQDSSGKIVFEKTMANGEVASASGQLPLAVVIGNASAIEVTVRGKPLSLDTLSKSNVAHFEVK